MGIEAKHYYRFGYLKSEQWQTVRIEALAREKGKCQICGEFSISSDAHHIEYPDNIWETKSSQLIILCRICHDLIHGVLKVHDVKKHTAKQFYELAAYLRVWIEAKNKQEIPPVDPVKPSDTGLTCQICKQKCGVAYSINFYEKFGCNKLLLSGCESCKVSATALLSELNAIPEAKFKFYEKWKKQRQAEGIARIFSENHHAE